jgi:hypothetical protein
VKPNHNRSGEKKKLHLVSPGETAETQAIWRKSDSKREVDDVETKTSTADKRSLKVYHVIKSH